MKLLYVNGVLSVILRVKILDSSAIDGSGLTGLTNASSGLIISTIADNEAAPTAYTAAAATIETIATLGTFAAPTATKCRFKEVDATNHPGLYELQITDARWAVTAARSVIVSISGATDAAETDAEVQLTVFDMNGAAATSPITGTVNDGSPTTTGFIGDSGLSSVDDFYNRQALVFTNGALAGRAVRITDYVGSTRQFTFGVALPVAPANGAAFMILGLIE